MNPFHLALLNSFGVVDVTPIGETLAYTWFGRPNYAWDETSGKYWIGSTKDTPSGTTQHVTEFDGAYTPYQVGTVYEKDDHNQAQILIRQSDQRLIAFYVEHNGAQLRWKISNNPLDASSWGAEKTHNPSQEYSYISPYQAANGDIFIFYRKRNPTEWSYCKSTDGGETFGAETPYWNTYNDGRNIYNITCQSDLDQNILHFVATDQHISYLNLVSVDIWHFYFDMSTETFYSSDGVAQTLPMGLSLSSKVINTESPHSCWITDIQVKNGNPRILYNYYPDGINNNAKYKDLYFSEWDGTAWSTPKFIVRELVGYIEDDGTIESIGYMPAARFDVVNKDIIWTSIEVNGILEMHKIDLSKNPIDIVQLTSNSEVNNWRPISIGLSENNLLWLKNNDYNSYTDYSITLQSLTVER